MIVAVAVTEKQVVVADQFNAKPITGRDAIFNRVNAPTEIRPVIEIVGVYTTLEMASRATDHHRASHPQCRYVQKVAQVDDAIPLAERTVKCIMCGVDSGGLSYCDPCNQKRMRALREADPVLMAEIAAAT